MPRGKGLVPFSLEMIKTTHHYIKDEDKLELLSVAIGAFIKKFPLVWEEFVFNQKMGRLMLMDEYGLNKTKSMRHVGRYPPELYNGLIRICPDLKHDQKFIVKFLNRFPIFQLSLKK